MKIQKISLLAAFFVAFSAAAFAQNDLHKNVFSGSVGIHALTFFNFTTNDISANDTSATLSIGSLTGKAVPTLQLAYDRGLNKWFSIGAGAAYGQYSLDLNEVKFATNDGKNSLDGQLDTRFARTTLQIRPLFHYANTGRLDLYSGIKLGVSIWSVRTKLKGTATFKDSNEFFDNVNLKRIPSFSGVLPAPNMQITILGLRGYLTENIGVGLEVNAGAPYIVSGQVSYRF